MSEKEKGFKVVDKRGQEEEEAQGAEEADSVKPEEAESREPGTGAEDTAEDEFPYEIDFINFILSLSHSVMVHLGKVPHPECEGACKVNLPMAKQGIDIIEMLQEKTEGNLTGDEERILTSILTDIRLAYVSESKNK